MTDKTTEAYAYREKGDRSEPGQPHRQNPRFIKHIIKLVTPEKTKRAAKGYRGMSYPSKQQSDVGFGRICVLIAISLDETSLSQRSYVNDSRFFVIVNDYEILFIMLKVACVTATATLRWTTAPMVAHG